MSPAVQAALSALGIPPLPRVGSDAYSDLIRTARLLRGEGRAVGLVPATARVAVPGVAIQLALALNEVGVKEVCVVDANYELPAFSDMAPIGVTAGPNIRHGFVAVPLGDGATLLTPHSPEPSLPLKRLDQLLPELRSLFDKVIVDLTGFREVGELVGACAILDGVLAVATTNVTLERELAGLVADLGDRPLLGTLLVG
ncbi:MAG: hypothetical protein SFV15_04060 [Polyangiaceae bacterium]|nr:hypothetical protein [Polyangiaceae bacterium]